MQIADALLGGFFLPLYVASKHCRLLDRRVAGGV